MATTLPADPNFYHRLGLPPNPADWTKESVEHLRSFLSNKRKLADALGFGSARVLEPEEAAKEAEKLSTKLFENQKALRYIVYRHEAVVQGRWLQMTQDERKKILLGAWPDMSPCHRPDLWALRRETAKEREAGTKFMDAYMWPDINLEDLSGDKPLLLLVRARGRRQPSVFAAADLESVHIGHLSKAIQGLFLPDYDMTMVGDSPAKYGKIYSNMSGEHADAMMEGKSYKSGDGMDVLEIQERLLGFLVTCCKSILSDKQIDVTDQSIPEVQAPPSKETESNNPQYDCVADMANEAPYVSPDSASFARWQPIVRDRLSDAEEHFRNLRQDPGYFADAARDWFEHAPELLVDEHGKQHPYLADPIKRPKFTDRTVGRMVHNAYEEIHVWKFLGEQFQYIRELLGEYGYESDPGDDMAFEDTMEKLKMLIDKRLVNHYLIKFASFSASSPPLRDLFKSVPDGMWLERIRPELKSGSVKDTDDELLWLWGQLTDNESRRICGLENLAGEMERFLEKNPDQKARLTPFVREVLSDFSFVGHLRRQLGMCWPCFFLSRGDKSMGHDTSQGIQWGRNLVSTVWSLVQLVNNSFGDGRIALGEAGDPSTGQFNYPVTELRTPQTTEAMRQAEKNLETFWAKFDRDLHSHMNPSIYASLQRLAPVTGPPAEDYRRCRLQGRDLEVFQTLFPNPDAEQTITKDIPWNDFVHALESISFVPVNVNGLLWGFRPTQLPVKSAVYFHHPYPGDDISAVVASRFARKLKHVYGMWWEMFE